MNFNNIKARLSETVKSAENVLIEVKKDNSKLKLIKKLNFPPLKGHPMLDQVYQRAYLLVKTYDEMYPGRQRSEPLNQEEILSLMNKVSDEMF